MRSNNLLKFNLYQLVSNVIGPVMPIGSRREDCSRLIGLKQLIELTDLLMDDLKSVASDADAEQISVADLGREAKEYLKSLQEDLEEALKPKGDPEEKEHGR